jgi:hypothetical protein
MRHRLFHFLAALSSFLCIACVALVVRARYRSDTIGWAGWRNEAARKWHGFGINSEGSQFLVYYFRFAGGKFDDPTNLNGSVPDMQPHAFHHVMGSRDTPARFVWKRIPYSPSLTFYLLGLPHLLLLGVCAIAPMVAIACAVRGRLQTQLHERRFRAGHCEACSYDLRASVNRCPECGTIPHRGSLEFSP